MTLFLATEYTRKVYSWLDLHTICSRWKPLSSWKTLITVQRCGIASVNTAVWRLPLRPLVSGTWPKQPHSRNAIWGFVRRWPRGRRHRWPHWTSGISPRRNALNVTSTNKIVSSMRASISFTHCIDEWNCCVLTKYQKMNRMNISNTYDKPNGAMVSTPPQFISWNIGRWNRLPSLFVDGPCALWSALQFLRKRPKITWWVVCLEREGIYFLARYPQIAREMGKKCS